MTHKWDTLPLLPLRCILDHLSTEDAFAAMSTCRHWRNAVLLYEGHRDTLKLRAKNIEKNMYLSRVFRRHTRKLHIYIDCSVDELERFMNFVLPQFFDTAKLQELIFIGPSYMFQNHHVPFVKLKRIITESLVFKHLHCLQKLAFMGCGMGALKSENKRCSQQKQIEYYSRSLKFSSVQSPADSILSSTNQHLMQFSTLSHIMVDYDQINTSSLETLSHLSNFRHLSLNITNKKQALEPIDWHQLQHVYKEPLQVTVNIIAVPYRRFEEIMENVLVDGLTLMSLKVMFCKSLYTPLLSHVTRLYQSTLQEVVWADSPYDSSDPYHRIVRPLRHAQPDSYAHVNSFVLLCWQCMHLRRLVIHGYWVWQYDVLGFVRLRKTLSTLEISAIYNKQDRFNKVLQFSEEGAVRVLCQDTPPVVDTDFIQEVNEYTEFNWRPTSWGKLHPALKARSTPQQRADYVVNETRMTPGVTLY